MRIVGQKNNLELIQGWKKLPNFVIIQGEEHTGKRYLVLYLCKLFNLHYVEVPKSVNNIRDLISVMSPNSNTVYHIDNFDDASIQAKNTLLKVTEEPVPGNYIIITGGPQIKTLQSRARIIIMSPYEYEDIKDLYSHYYGDIDSRKLYDVGINTPARIEYYRNSVEEIRNLINYVYNIFNRITYLNTDDFVPLMRLFDSRYEKDSIDYCMLFLDMLIKLIENKINESLRYSYYEILQSIITAKNDLKKEYTLNRKLLIFRLFYSIMNVQDMKVRS